MICFPFCAHHTVLPWTVLRPLAPWPDAYGGTPNIVQVGDEVPRDAFAWRDDNGEWLWWTSRGEDIRVPFATLWDACKP